MTDIRHMPETTYRHKGKTVTRKAYSRDYGTKKTENMDQYIGMHCTFKYLILVRSESFPLGDDISLFYIVGVSKEDPRYVYVEMRNTLSLRVWKVALKHLVIIT